MNAEVHYELFINVLQHLHGDIKGIQALGWGPSRDQEAEAYAHQNQADHLLQLLRANPETGRSSWTENLRGSHRPEFHTDRKD